MIVDNYISAAGNPARRLIPPAGIAPSVATTQAIVVVKRNTVVVQHVRHVGCAIVLAETISILIARLASGYDIVWIPVIVVSERVSRKKNEKQK